MSNLYFTIGVARCGKSTYCDRWVRHLQDVVQEPDGNVPRPRAIVCSDDIRMALHGQRYKSEAEPMVWAINTYMARSLMRRGHDVIIDGTNTTPESIRRILRIDLNARHILIDTAPEECERRAMACGQDDLVTHGVIRRQSNQLEKMKAAGIECVMMFLKDEVSRGH